MALGSGFLNRSGSGFLSWRPAGGTGDPPHIKCLESWHRSGFHLLQTAREAIIITTCTYERLEKEPSWVICVLFYLTIRSALVGVILVLMQQSSLGRVSIFVPAPLCAWLADYCRLTAVSSRQMAVPTSLWSIGTSSFLWQSHR